jgi:hypothetical protein
VTDPGDWPIILEPGEDGGTLMGESREEVQRGIDAGVLYVCPVNDGTCPEGHHRGGPFLHYCDGKTPDDYDAL